MAWQRVQVLGDAYVPDAPLPGKPPKVTKDGFQLPRAEEGTELPLVYGRCRLVPLLSWNGYLETVTNDNSNNGAQVKGYGVNMLFKIGIPMGAGVATASKFALNAPRLYNVWFGDKKLQAPVQGCIPALAANLTLVGQAVWDAEFFGGQGNGGGIRGTYRFFGGYTDQTLLDSIVRTVMCGAPYSILSNKLPGHRGQMLLWLGQYENSNDPASYDVGTSGVPSSADLIHSPATSFGLGESASVAAVAVEVSSYGEIMWSMVNPGFDFGGDADPAQVIYDLLTNAWSRGGIDPAKVDTASFAAASATLAAEGHGYSNVLTSTSSISQCIVDILDQIDGVLYVEPTTGLYTLKLIRQDYDVSTIPSFDDTAIIDVDYTMTGWTNELVNEVRVSFTDRIGNYKTSTAIAQSSATSQGVGGNKRIIKEVSYPGISNATIATRVAGRELGLVGRPLGTGTFTFNRTASGLRPGGVFKATYAPRGFNSTVFRVKKIDPGKLDDNTIIVEVVQDLYTSAYAGTATATGTFVLPSPYPLSPRTITEAPRWLTGQAAASGLVADPDTAHLLPLLSASTNAVSYSLKTKQTAVDPTAVETMFAFWLVDIPQIPFPTTFTLASSYALELAPYDTTTGLVVQDVAGSLAPSFASVLITSILGTHDQIANHGRSLFVVVASNGDQEFMAFESVSSLGGGQYRLNSVWRGLMDTPPIAHTSGERGYFVDANMVGRRGWSVKRATSAWLIPAATFIVGSGGDPIDKLQVIDRSVLALPPANVTVAGEGIQGGVLGLPSIAGQYKSATLLEEGFDLYGYRRERLNSSIARGDEADDSITLTATYNAYAQLQGYTHVPGEDLGSFVATDLASKWNGHLNVSVSRFGTVVAIGGQCLAGGGWTVDGYGMIDLVLEATWGAAFPNAGILAASRLCSWQKARVPVFAPSWRNLLANCRWNYLGGSNAIWADSAGTSGIGTGTFSLSRAASGAGSYFLKAAVATTTLTEIQTVKVVQWIPRGLTAVLVGYFRNANSDTNDTGQLTVNAYDWFGISLLGTASNLAAAPATTSWTRRTVSLALPSGTGRVDYNATMVEVAAGGGTSGTADTCFTEPELRIGQFDTTSGLVNTSFELGTTGSWTNDTNSMIVATTVASPSANYCQGGAFASSQIHQDYTPGTGHDYGDTALLTLFMGSTLANDTGKVTLQALDAGLSVLASQDTGALSFSTLNVWNKKTLWLALPDGTATVRVVINATRTLGSGNSGAIFDEFALWLSKDLDARTTLTADFSAPKVQATPNDAPTFELAYPTLAVPAYILGGTHFNANEINWTDAVVHPTGKLCGQFGGGVASIDAYSFVRGTGAAAVHAAAIGQGRTLIANYSLATAFSVACMFRVDEPGFAAACGLVGRMDLTAGWGLGIDATGHPYALLRGAGSTTKTVTASATVHEGGLHLVQLVNDPVGQLLVLYVDGVSAGSISTAAGIGEIGRTASTCHLRIGRDADDHDVLPGMVGRVWIWASALTSGNAATLWTYGADPTGLVTTYTRTATAIVPGLTDTAGATAYVMPVAQVAQPYYPGATYATPSLTADGGTGYGLAAGKSCTNLVPTFDFTASASWAPDASTTLTQGIVDVTGRPRGVTVLGNASNGITLKGVTVGAGAQLMLVCWLRTSTGTPSLNVTVKNSAGVVKIGPIAVVLSTSWQMFQLTLTGWDASTPTCWLQLISASGTLQFDIAGVLSISQGTDFPAILPLALATHGNYNATIAHTLPVQFNSEGELIAEGVAMVDAPSTTVGTLVSVQNGVNNKNRRDLSVRSGSAGWRCAHWDGAAVEVDADAAYSTYADTVWKARSRWCRAGMLDNTSPQDFSAAAWTDTSHTTPTIANGRTAAWTFDTTQATTVKIGAGVAAPSDVVLRKVTVRTREEKLV